MENIAERTELLQILTQKARNGSVYAARCLLDELRGEEGTNDNGNGFEELDAHSNVTPLARRRS